VDEVKQLVKLPKYESWTNYKEWLGLNAEGMYQHLQKQPPEAPRRREDPDVPPHR
jgi:hypothetical protein